MAALSRQGSDLYSPRSAWFGQVITCGSAQIKLNLISAQSDSLTADKITAAAQQISAAAGDFSAYALHDAGFAILHEGEEALWLLLHQWIDGGICTQHLWRSDLTGAVSFRPAPAHLMACVWELAIIDFERRAWIETVMAGLPHTAYLSRTLPRGKL
ncbi:hypothetical protein [Pseudochrobactrum asaccharolyticum]|jgi:hypothetical protein|uniref:Uncharacterized protein n=1 Tax=Pseudochrobactrum asaccharolyticum TaxID=354351 RepID=A0A366E8R1_9HYPH|nr:hypothetical protein [Pseudochrobactrum asaccharolyticum]MBX8799922.1 hypothetical protein [Ochrobactrum sp. MR28]MBX8815321.1 hypothetical protein [Ochrobactrum sp. MR31]MCF7670179.1 hypothetical protein [Bacillus subtilis]MDR2311322.1 hypothetical protein [Brucellaceae bacterium]MCF7644582.1 hypothetical protein [Pseudochrobactrum asaccharolyticum]